MLKNNNAGRHEQISFGSERQKKAPRKIGVKDFIKGGFTFGAAILALVPPDKAEAANLSAMGLTGNEIVVYGGQDIYLGDLQHDPVTQQILAEQYIFNNQIQPTTVVASSGLTSEYIVANQVDTPINTPKIVEIAAAGSNDSDVSGTVDAQNKTFMDNVNKWMKDRGLSVDAKAEFEDSTATIEGDLTKTWNYNINGQPAQAKVGGGAKVNLHNLDDSQLRTHASHNQELGETSAVGFGGSAAVNTQGDVDASVGLGGVTKLGENQADLALAVSRTGKIADGEIQVSNQEVYNVLAVSVTGGITTEAGNRISGQVTRVFSGDVKDTSDNTTTKLNESITATIGGEIPTNTIVGKIELEASITKPDEEPVHGGSVEAAINPAILRDHPTRVAAKISRERTYESGGTMPLTNNYRVTTSIGNLGINGLTLGVSGSYDKVNKFTPGLTLSYSTPVETVPEVGDADIATKIEQDGAVLQMTQQYAEERMANKVEVADLKGTAYVLSKKQKQMESYAANLLTKNYKTQDVNAEHYSRMMAIAAGFAPEQLASNLQEFEQIVAESLAVITNDRFGNRAYMQNDMSDDYIDNQLLLLRGFAAKGGKHFGKTLELAKIDVAIIQAQDIVYQISDGSGKIGFNPLAALNGVLRRSGITNVSALANQVLTAANASVSRQVANANKNQTTTTETAADLTPDVFSFTNKTNQTTNSTSTSVAVIISGLTGSAPISVSGSTGFSYSINGGGFTAVAGTIQNGDSLQVRVDTGGASVTTSVEANINNVKATFSATTLPF